MISSSAVVELRGSLATSATELANRKLGGFRYRTDELRGSLATSVMAEVEVVKALCMQKTTLAILIGGLLPAVLFGISAVMQKASVKAGIGTGPYLIVIGLVALTAGIAVTAIQGDRTVSLQSALNTCAYGIFWSSGIMCIAVALRQYDARISQLVPLYNMNTLVAVGLGLMVLGEWRQVNAWRLLFGAGLAVVGGVLAASSTNANVGE